MTKRGGSQAATRRGVRERGARDPDRASNERAAAAQLAGIVAACQADADAVATHRAAASKLASRLGGDLAFRWQLVELGAALSGNPITDDDWVRERYGELVDRHRDQPAALAQIRALGDRIRELERAGVLPAAMVLRSKRPSRTRRPTA